MLVVHEFPHPSQLFSSLVVSTQEPSHRTGVAVGQLDTQE